MSPGSCVVWEGACSADGYGQKWFDGRAQYVHRLIWTEYHGPIPDGLFVLHKCDNPPCYRIDHLFLGTSKDNAVDMATKGRQVFQRNPEKHTRGTKHHNAKVTPELVREIRLSSSSQREIAEVYGLSQSTVWSILRRRTWKEVSG